MKMRELEFIECIRNQEQFSPALVPLGPGDDCAIVTCGSEKLLVSADQLLDGVHFDLKGHGPEAMGRKAMARAISDIAAMAAAPLAAVITIAMPRGFSQADAEAFYRGTRGVADEFKCPVVGGDIAAWNGKAAVSVTVYGRSAGVQAVLRSGAKVGDAVCVTGSLGGAWLGQRHLNFRPRVREAKQLAALCNLHAMIDVSDGLALDLWRVCKASGVAAEIVAEDVPVHPEAAGGRNVTPLQAALADGEDYELLFALPEDQAASLVDKQPLDVPVSRIGRMVEGNGLYLIRAGGAREELKPEGWQHET